MRWDAASGKLGIGTTPVYILNVAAPSGSQYIFQAAQTGVSNGYTISSNGSALTHQWYNASGEAARLDTAGNLIVGKTDTTFSTEGIVAFSSSDTYGSRINITNSGETLNLNRTGSDGSIVVLYKNQSASGSIRAVAGEISIGSPNAYLWTSGNNTAFLPASTATGGASNGLLDLGSSGRRFKTLFLGGEVKFVSTSYDDRSFGIDSLGFYLYNNNDSRVDWRVDDSGNFLIGKNALDNTTAGTRINSDGSASFVKNGNLLYLNRNTTDGDIVTFARNNTAVGSVGSEGGDSLYIVSGDAGLRFSGGSDAIIPVTTGGAVRDAAIALGTSNARFADFWLKNGGALFFGDGSHFIVGGASYGGGDLKIRASDDINLNARWVRYHDDVGSAGEYARIAYNGSWVNSNLTINALQIGTNSSNVTVLNSSRQLQNVTLLATSQGARRATNAWHEDASGQQRFYFLANSHMYLKTGGSFIFRSSSDTGLATLSNYGGINLMSGNDSTLGSADALAVSATTVLTSSRGLKNITSLGINGTAGTTYPIYASSAQRYIMALRNTAADANYPWLTHDTASSMSRFGVHFNGAGDQFYVYENGVVQANGSFQAPGFYDTNNSNYFLDPASTGTSGKFRRFVQVGDSSTYGSNSGGWGARLNVTDDVHARIDVGQDDNNMLSHWYAHTGQSDIKFGTATAHNVSFQRGGTTQLFLDSTHAGANNQFRSPIYYDFNNTNYYVDPNGYSVIAGLFVGDGSALIKIGDEGEGANSSYSRIRTNSSGDLFIDQKDGRNLYLSWWTGGSARVFSEAGAQFPIYYDRNNTGYYVNPASTSRTNEILGNQYRTDAGNGRGLRFWDSDQYKIYMSAYNDSTFGGRVDGETTSDYNMYFKMSAGTNRGFVFRNNTNNVAGIDASGNARFEGNVIAYSSSDRKLKSRIRPIENALEKVCSLNGYEFEWNDKQTIHEVGKADIGVIAQEVLEQFPTVVAERTTADGETHLG